MTPPLTREIVIERSIAKYGQGCYFHSCHNECHRNYWPAYEPHTLRKDKTNKYMKMQ